MCHVFGLNQYEINRVDTAVVRIDSADILSDAADVFSYVLFRES